MSVSLNYVNIFYAFRRCLYCIKTFFYAFLCYLVFLLPVFHNALEPNRRLTLNIEFCVYDSSDRSILTRMSIIAVITFDQYLCGSFEARGRVFESPISVATTEIFLNFSGCHCFGSPRQIVLTEIFRGFSEST